MYNVYMVHFKDVYSSYASIRWNKKYIVEGNEGVVNILYTPSTQQDEIN